MKHGLKMGFKKTLNTQPESKNLLELLHHELAQLAEINHKQFLMIINRPVLILKTEVVEEPTDDVKNDVPDAALMEENARVVTGMKAVMKLREEFPFLNEASCPDEFKILVADKYSTYLKFKEAHANLFKAENEDDLLKTSKDVVENVLENQLIWDELDHYKQTGEILGKHAIFTRIDLREKYMAMPIPDLILARENCKKRISALNTEIKANKKPEKLHEKQDNLKAKEEELDILNKLLGFKEKPIEPVVAEKTEVIADTSADITSGTPADITSGTPADLPSNTPADPSKTEKAVKKASPEKVVKDKA